MKVSNIKKYFDVYLSQLRDLQYEILKDLIIYKNYSLLIYFNWIY